MNKMSPIVHFELPYNDGGRIVEFYEKAFGWQSEMLGPKMGNYIITATSETDEKTKFPLKPGMINGGFFEKTKDVQHPSVVVGVDDIRESMKKVEEAGGKILGGQKAGEPDDIPGIGQYISFTDTEGNRVGMIQPVPM